MPALLSLPPKEIFSSWAASAGTSEVELTAALLRVAVTILLAQVLAMHFVRFAGVLSNKRKFARSFVLIAVTTQLVIGVVATSIALSLGLVGALSIVRFRTPVKEPEELCYLFLAIAVGIGVGAGRIVLTVSVVAVLLLYLTVQGGFRLGRVRMQSLLQVDLPPADRGRAREHHRAAPAAGHRARW